MKTYTKLRAEKIEFSGDISADQFILSGCAYGTITNEVAYDPMMGLYCKSAQDFVGIVLESSAPRGV